MRSLRFETLGVLTAAAAILAVAVPVRGDDTGDTTLGAALTGGTFSFGLRYRYEEVDQGGFDDADDWGTDTDKVWVWTEWGF